MNRIRVSYLMAAFVLLLVACNSSAPAQGAVPGASSASPIPTAPPNTASLEIYTVWGESAEIGALNALVGVFRRQNPDLAVAPTNAGGGGAGTPDLLVRRLEREEPPDSWQVHAGKESLDYVVHGQLEPITKLFKEQKLDQVLPPLLLDQLTIKGEIYTVPVNIQRSNLLWYNTKVFQSNNLKPPRTMEEFFSVAEILKSKGITPLATGGSFEIGQMFESILVATYGPEDYVRLVNGDSALWEDPRLMTAIHSLKRMLDYANTDRSGMDWSIAAQRVLDGKAGMTVTGDWAEGNYTSEGAKPNVDFGWEAAPGTEGTFIWLSDSFGLARGAPHPDAALAWLKTVGSKEGQDAFNPIKGSISPRSDADKNLYDEYLRWSFDQFREDKLAPSIMHGAATPDAYRGVYSRSLIDFSQNLDEQALAEALKDAVPLLTQ